MITVHVSPFAQTVSIENLPEKQTLLLSPEDAYSIYQRLQERWSEIRDMVSERRQEKEC